MDADLPNSEMPYCKTRKLFRFQVTGMIEWGQKSKPQKIPRASNKTQKIPWTKLKPQKDPNLNF